ncbi:MAG: hypothetical protein J5911_03965, partial [Clostridia bacterium]|nr:hypothetical protein [Clostridia bacterium]
MVIKRSNLFIAFLSFILVLSAALFGLTGGFYTAHAADFTVTGFSYSSVYNSELYLFQIDVSCTLTKNDLDNFNVADVTDYVEINGKSVTEWNSDYIDVARSDWAFPDLSPWNETGFYNHRPIVLRSTKNSVRLFLHRNLYSAIVTAFGKMTVQIKSGMSAQGNTLSADSAKYKVIETAGVPSGAEVMPDGPEITEFDITAQTFIRNFDVENELKKVYVDCGAGVSMPKIDFHAIDSDDYKYIADYIAINGKTITEINATTDTTGWTFTKFPSTAADKYKLPIILYIPENQNYIELRIHENYYDALEGNMTVAVLAG